MIHQPLISGVIQGQASDLEIHGQEILKTRDRLAVLYAEYTGKSKEEILKSIERDTWMSAQEAKDFGLLDGIVTSFDKL
jgi:ATP-dependent Clp protease protease subunit